MSANKHFPGGWSRRVRMLAILPLLALISPVITSYPAAAASPARPGSASIRTPDFDETIEWYQDKLGFRLLSTRTLVRERVAVLERAGFLLEIAEADHPMPTGTTPDVAATSATPVPVVSILVPDVDKEVARLRREGVEILEEPADELEGIYRVAHIRDNGRHRIELREPLRPTFNAMGR